MLVEDIGEFGLIERISKILNVPSEEVIVSLGDDAAVVRTTSDLYSILTTDILIEDVHFQLGSISPYQLGYKALAVNISDIAAMAGLPRFALVSLGLRLGTEVQWVEELYKGMLEVARKYGTKVVGGDTSKSAQTVINVTVMGEVEPELLRTRDGAQMGDRLMVTGHLGGSAAGLELLTQPRLR